MSPTGPNAVSLEGAVKRDDIIFVKLDRDEQEIVALPERVRIVAVQYCMMKARRRSLGRERGQLWKRLVAVPVAL